MLELVDNFEEKQQEATSSTLPWVEVHELPSEFKGYPDGTKVSYEPCTLEELEKLNGGVSDNAQVTEQTVLRGISELLKAIHTTTIKPENLYFWDVMYIGIRRKLLALGDDRGIVGAICPECGKQHIHEYHLQDLEFKEFNVPALPAKTEINGVELHFIPTTIRRFLESSPTDGLAGTYAGMVCNLPYAEALEVIKKATGKDILKLRHISDLFTLGWKPFVKECDGEKEIDNPDYNPNYKPKKGDKTNKLQATIKVPCKTRLEMEVDTPFEVVFPEDISNNFEESEIRFG